MKASTLAEIKKELTELPLPEVMELTLRLGRYKKENKELLTYLLFESQDEAAFIRNIKSEIDMGFEEMNRSNLHLVKKTLRKIIRFINKYVRFSASRGLEVELRIYFCSQLKNSGIKIRNSQALINLYENQLKKIKSTMDKLHEDLQYDYLREFEKLSLAT